jgi:hypothetical protein
MLATQREKAEADAHGNVAEGLGVAAQFTLGVWSNYLL